MENACSLKVLLVAEGSGGHFIPALEVARELVRAGARVNLWYTTRPQAASLVQALWEEVREASSGLEVTPIRNPGTRLGRLWSCLRLWWFSQRWFHTFRPNVVVGFGGWLSVPVLLAARTRRIRVLLHEQNVHLGGANRLLEHWVNRIAVSFQETIRMINPVPRGHPIPQVQGQTLLWNGSHARRLPSYGVNGPSYVVTGLPVRRLDRPYSRQQAAARFGFDVTRPTLLILGGSQGAHAVNRLLIEALPTLSEAERRTWQIIHLTGADDESTVKAAYMSHGIRVYVAAFMTDMDMAYAHADLAIVRAGASTIAELAQWATPAILIPYPLANGHQRANARVVEAVGGGILLEEAEATPERLLEHVRLLLRDRDLRERLSARVRTLAVPDATARLTRAIVELAAAPAVP